MSAYVYIMSNASHTIYVGSTVDLQNRVREHKEQLNPNWLDLSAAGRRVVLAVIVPV